MLIKKNIVTYKIRALRNKKVTGLTQPIQASLEAILKFDGSESPHCVYNEYVALRLAQSLNIPVADGVLVELGDSKIYASLEVASPGISLPDLHDRYFEEVSKKYPEHVAATVIFDIWIGNWDRANNIKASLYTQFYPLFILFDHSHALLNIDNTPTKSIQSLRSLELISNNHPFYKLITTIDIKKWLKRISKLDDEYIDEACRYGKLFSKVSPKIQSSLANALKVRRDNLDAIFNKYNDKIVNDL